MGFRSRRVFWSAAILILVSMGAIGIRLCPDHGLPPKTDETADGTPGEATGPSDRPARSEGATGDLETSATNPAPSVTPHGHKFVYTPLAEVRFTAKREQVENSILTGTVMDETGTPRPDAELSLYLDATDLSPFSGKVEGLVSDGEGYFPQLTSPVKVARTNETGSYEMRLDGLDAATKPWMTVSAPGCAASCVQLDLSSGEGRKDFEIFCRTISLTGRVVDTDGGPIAGAQVVAQIPGIRNRRSPSIRLVETDEAGRFAIRHLALVTNMRVTAWAVSHEGQLWYLRLDSAEDQTLEFRLRRTRPTILRILDKRDRSPIPGAEVQCRDSKAATALAPNAFIVAPDHSDEDGRVALGVPVGPEKWICRIRAVGYAQREVPLLVESMPEAVLLAPSSEFDGCVTTSHGRPVDGATVSLAGIQSWRGSAETDGTGCFSVDAPAQKITDALIKKRGFLSVEMSSSEGLSSPLGVTLEPSETGIRGQVFKDGAPFRQPFVVVFRSTDTRRERNVLFPNAGGRGTFDVFEFPAGEYDILILTELRAEDSRAVPFSACFESVEMRRGFVTGPLIAHLQEGIRSGFELD